MTPRFTKKFCRNERGTKFFRILSNTKFMIFAGITTPKIDKCPPHEKKIRFPRLRLRTY